MTAEEHKLFTTKGYFTTRCSDKFWYGMLSDMMTEKSLTRAMKCLGGLTHGRGVKESVLCKWSLGMVFLHNIYNEVEKFCNVAFSISEQHVEMRSSQINRDNDDEKIDNGKVDWLCNHPPLPEVKELMSIITGVIGDERDFNETDNPIRDGVISYVKQISICDVSIGTENVELATPGPSRTAKQKRTR